MKKTLLVPCLLLSMAWIRAQDAAADFQKVSERKDWGFSISPYAWLAGMSTDVGGEKLRQSFNDLSSITKVSAFGPMLGVSFML